MCQFDRRRNGIIDSKVVQLLLARLFQCLRQLCRRRVFELSRRADSERGRFLSILQLSISLLIPALLFQKVRLDVCGDSGFGRVS